MSAAPLDVATMQCAGGAERRIRRRIETLPGPVRAWAEEALAATPPTMDAAELRGLAAQVYEAPLGVVWARHPSGGDAVLVGDVVVVRPGLDEERETVALVHEAAHWICRCLRHSHGDVWLVTILALDIR